MLNDFDQNESFRAQSLGPVLPAHEIMKENLCDKVEEFSLRKSKQFKGVAENQQAVCEAQIQGDYRKLEALLEKEMKKNAALRQELQNKDDALAQIQEDYRKLEALLEKEMKTKADLRQELHDH